VTAATVRSQSNRPQGRPAPPHPSTRTASTNSFGEQREGVADADRAGDAAVIPLGRLVNVHATRGELRMLPFNPHSTTLSAGAAVVLRRGDDRQRRHINAIRPHKRFLLLTLEGCASMAAAEALVGYEVCVAEDDLPPAGPGEIYHYQLLGMTVVTTTGAELGVVGEVFATAGHDVCVVRSPGAEHLIPLTTNIVKEVDRERLRLVIDPLPGLLDG
jgi:16S rRNA processing protein RimM